MRVLISGATGLIGTALRRRLAPRHSVTVLTRSTTPGEGALRWDVSAGVTDLKGLEGMDAVVHLAGEPITGRWTESKKRAIRKSRVEGTRTLCRQLARLDRPPKTFVSASAVGYYGDAGDARLSEDSPKGKGFLPDVCEAWEAAAEVLKPAAVRVVHARFGMVLSPEGGALARLLPLFRACLGGRVGSGRQYWSWVALPDAAAALAWCLEKPEIEGPVNVTAPEPVTNKDFTRCLAEAVNRPAIVPLPAWTAKLFLGEMAEALLLSGARVLPERLLQSGFIFQSPSLEKTFTQILADK